MDADLWAPVRRALRAAWLDFWLLFERYAGTIFFYLVCYMVLALFVRLIAPEVFDLRDDGPLSETGLGIGLLLSPFSLLMYLVWGEVRGRSGGR